MMCAFFYIDLCAIHGFLHNYDCIENKRWYCKAPRDVCRSRGRRWGRRSDWKKSCRACTYRAIWMPRRRRPQDEVHSDLLFFTGHHLKVIYIYMYNMYIMYIMYIITISLSCTAHMRMRICVSISWNHSDTKSPRARSGVGGKATAAWMRSSTSSTTSRKLWGLSAAARHAFRASYGTDL